MLSCYYQNVRGLNSKTQLFYLSSVAASHLHLIALTETWLSDSVCNSELFDLSKYNVFRKDRDFSSTGCRRGGGVLLAVDSAINSTICDIVVCDTIPHIDFLIVKIHFHHRTLHVLVIYIPPQCDVNSLSVFFDFLTSLHFLYDSDLLVVGDFNVPDFIKNVSDLSPSSTSKRLLNNFLNFYQLRQCNDIFNINDRLLDLVMVSDSTFCSISRAQDPFVLEDNHHPALEFDLIIHQRQKKFPKRKISEFNFRKCNFNLLYATLSTVDWTFLANYSHVDVAVSNFHQVLNDIFHRHVPLKRHKPGNYPAWFDKNIIRTLKQKSTARKKYKKSMSILDFDTFAQLRARLKSDIDVAYKNFLQKVNTNLKSNPREFWSFVNSKRNSSPIPTTMFLNGNKLIDPQDIVNSFADHFSRSFKKTDEVTIPSVPISNNILNLPSVSEQEVLQALKKLKATMTRGPDQIPAFLISDCASVFVKPLTLIFNLILKSCDFPCQWKTSKICPVYKKGVKSDITNYRPISIISNFAKVFEYLLYNIFSFHVSSVLSLVQHGFVQGRSPESNLCTITQFLSTALDDKLQVDVVYTDFSSAFDKVDHSLLLRKLERFGLSVNLVSLLDSYLVDRYLYVYVNGYTSKQFRQETGVPQGSVLGPLLFNIFINDVVEVINLSCLLFADDMKIYSVINSMEDAFKLQQCVDSIVKWCTENNLLLNHSKCNVVSYTKKKELLSFDYNINGAVISRVDSVRDLGIIFDEKLSFVPYVQSVINSAIKSLGFVLRNGREFCDVETLKLLYITYVRSRLEYSSVVWSPTYNIHISALERVQRKFLKSAVFMLDKVYPTRGYPEELLLERFNMSSLSTRRAEHSVIFLHKLWQGRLNCPSLLSEICLKVNRPGARSKNTFFIPTKRTTTGTASPIYQMLKNYEAVESALDIFCCTIPNIKRHYSNKNPS